MASKKKSNKPKSNKLLVGAIDFGTTFSSWAYSFDHDFNNNPSKVACKQWIGGSSISNKAPTTVLVKPDRKTLEAFGYDAETKYAQLAEDDEHERYYYFKRFKMMLFGNDSLSRRTQIEDEIGRAFPAKTVFVLAITYLKEDLLKTCSTRVAGNALGASDVYWVITVPAIWNDSAKQFMREAAVAAGIPGNKLTIGLEPEVASMFCRLLPVEKMVGNDGRSLSEFKPGTKYLVLDAGGGTVDITVHEVLGGGKLRECHKASGGAWGGTRVDEAFINIFVAIVGNTIFRTFRKQHMDDFLDMMRNFEVKKREILPEKDDKVTIRFPTTLKDLLPKEKKDLQTAISQGIYAGQITLEADKLKISASVMKNLFSRVINDTVSHLKILTTEPLVEGFDTILMVGGFSESPMLQKAVRSNFPDVRIIIPEEAGLVVLKGAVVFGHSLSASPIVSRVSKYTYGVAMYTIFKPGRHPESRKIIHKGVQRVKGAFAKLVEEGQTLELDKTYGKQSCHPTKGTKIDLKLFKSSEKDPVFADDPSCTLVGSIKVDCMEEHLSATVELMFGGTEIDVIARHNTTGEITSATFDCLDGLSSEQITCEPIINFLTINLNCAASITFK